MIEAARKSSDGGAHVHPMWPGALSLALLLAFATVAMHFVMAKGVCCGDDAYHSVIAKNLSNGLGYASSIQPFVSRYAIRPFDPLVGTGPTIILPASLSITIFGNTYWAPGLANVVVWSLLLAGIGFCLRRYDSGMRYPLFTVAFLGLSYSLMTFHLEHWYALLGEVPAALLILLSLLLLVSGGTKSNQLWSGILLSLAVQAKLLALLAMPALVLAHLLMRIDGRPAFSLARAKTSAIAITYFSVGLAIPLLLFESWKFLAIGPGEYVDIWRAHLGYVGTDGIRVSRAFSVTEMYTESSQVLMNRFSVSLPLAGVILAVGWIISRKDDYLRGLFLGLLAIIGTYCFWWIFLSTGSARYFIICLIVLTFAMALPVLAGRSRSHVLLYLALLALFSSRSWTRLHYPFEESAGDFFKPAAGMENLLKASQDLSQCGRSVDGRIATQWWATAADVEYIMATSLNLTTYRDADLKDGRSFCLVVNRRFENAADEDFRHLVARCEPGQEIGAYLIARCEAGVLR